MLIDGIHVPLTVPFTRDGKLYLSKLEHNVGRYSLSPVSGLVALALGSEASALSDEETAAVLHAVGRSAAREKVLVAAIARDSVHAALQLATEAEAAGFDALLLQPPRNWRELMHEGGLSRVLLFFRAVADAAALPVLLWSDLTELELTADAVAELALHPNIVGMYDAGLTPGRYSDLAAATAYVRREVTVTPVFAPATRRMLAHGDGSAGVLVPAAILSGGTALSAAAAMPALKTRTKTVGFQIMAAGSCTTMLPLLQAGAAGAMPQLAACAPQGCYEVFAAFKDGDPALSAEKALRLEDADRLMYELGTAGVKYASDLNGYFGGVPRLPKLPLLEEQRAEVNAAMREVRN